MLSKRERDLNRREASLTAHTAELSARKAQLDDLQLSRMSGERASWLKQLCPEFA